MENSKLQNLPIFKHFEGSEISKSVDSFRKGEKFARSPKGIAKLRRKYGESFGSDFENLVTPLSSCLFILATVESIIKLFIDS